MLYFTCSSLNKPLTDPFTKLFHSKSSCPGGWVDGGVGKIEYTAKLSRGAFAAEAGTELGNTKLADQGGKLCFLHSFTLMLK